MACAAHRIASNRIRGYSGCQDQASTPSSELLHGRVLSRGTVPVGVWLSRVHRTMEMARCVSREGGGTLPAEALDRYWIALFCVADGGTERERDVDSQERAYAPESGWLVASWQF